MLEAKKLKSIFIRKTKLWSGKCNFVGHGYDRERPRRRKQRERTVIKLCRVILSFNQTVFVHFSSYLLRTDRRSDHKTKVNPYCKLYRKKSMAIYMPIASALHQEFYNQIRKTSNCNNSFLKDNNTNDAQICTRG